MLNSIYGKIIVAIIIFLILDGIWLGFLANKLYIDNIGSILRMHNGSIKANWLAAIVVYIALISGICVFVLPQAGSSAVHALLLGAFFGFVTYATYDFTNLAVLENWSLKISIIDTIWGMVLCGLTSSLTVLITSNA